jgi:CheY-like chemotaxis protein
MARVLIAEPEPDLRRLAEQALLELGHEPLSLDADILPSRVDVLLLAASADAVALAHALRRRHPGLSIISLGTVAAGPETRALRPVAHLVKPYTLGELGRALARAETSARRT